MPVTTRHLDGLIAFQRAVLYRTERMPDVALGPLISIYLDSHGWTPDGVAVARRLLDGMLAEYEKSTKPLTQTAFSRTERASALRLYWGIDEYPAKASEAAASLGSSTQSPPATNTLYGWQQAVIEDRSVLKWVNDQTLPPPASAPLDWPRPSWRAPQHEWPADKEWPPGSLTGGIEARAILGGARAVASENQTDSTMLQALREVVSEELERYFGSPNHTTRFRHMRDRVVGPWAEMQKRGFFVPPFSRSSSATRDSDVRDSVATAAQMFFHEAVSGAGALTARLRSRIAAVAEIDEVIDLATRAILVAQNLPVDGQTASAGSEHKPAALIEMHFSIPADTTDESTHDRVLWLYEHSQSIRKSPPFAIVEFIDSYVKHRLEIDWYGLTIADAVLLELADQSVHLDAARAKNADLVSRMTAIIQTPGHTPAGNAYRVLANREQSLIHTKNNEHAEAAHSIAQGFEQLHFLGESGAIDRRASMEAAHQLALAGAGVFLHLLETHMCNTHTTPRRPRADIQLAARNAVFFSRIASDRLNGLQESLTPVRHADNHISSTEWRMKTRAIALRVGLAVHTAVEARLCADPNKGSSRPIGERFDLSSLHENYMRLITLPELRLSDRREVIQASMWFGLLNSGELPLAPALTDALKRIEFIDGDPVDMGHSRPLDLHASSAWLTAEKSDAGILSRLADNIPASILLDERSNGMFTAARAVLPPAHGNKSLAPRAARGRQVYRRPDKPQR